MLLVLLQRVHGFMLDGGLEIMNEFKWKAIDIIEMLKP